MLKRILPASIIAVAALFLASTVIASPPSATIIAPRETSHFTFHAKPKRVETECEPTSAKAVLLAGRRTPLPVLLENQAHNGSVYLFEHGHNTCASVVNWTAHRARVHFALTLLDTVTRL